MTGLDILAYVCLGVLIGIYIGKWLYQERDS